MGIFWIVLLDFWLRLLVLKIFLKILLIDKKKNNVKRKVINFKFYLFFSILFYIFFLKVCVKLMFSK